MGIRYVCSRCGYVLHEYKIENGRVVVYPKSLSRLLTPTELAYHYYGRCPYCGKQLEPLKLRVRVWTALQTR